MVIVTTLVTPPALKITLARGDRWKATADDRAGTDRRRRPMEMTEGRGSG